METNGTFVNIQDWMLDYDLDLTETVVFAIIHGFSMNGECRFHGSRQYLAKHAKCSTDKVDKSLKKLRDLGLVDKTEIYTNGVKFCEYASTVGSRYGRQVAAGSGRGVAVEGGGGSRCERHNNIDDNIDNNNIESRGNAKRFTPPTLEEVTAYCEERFNLINPRKFMDYYEANGWMVGRNKMKDWRAAVRNWEAREKEQRNATSTRNIDPGSPAAYRHRGRGDDYGPSTI
jgi:hypothetical protein